MPSCLGAGSTLSLRKGALAKDMKPIKLPMLLEPTLLHWWMNLRSIAAVALPTMREVEVSGREGMAQTNVGTSMGCVA